MRSKFQFLSLLAGLTLAAAPASATAQRIVYRGYDSRDYDRREQALERANRARERAIEQSTRAKERAAERAAERAYDQRRVRNERQVAQSVARTNREIRNQLQRERRQFTRVTTPRDYYRNW